MSIIIQSFCGFDNNEKTFRNLQKMLDKLLRLCYNSINNLIKVVTKQHNITLKCNLISGMLQCGYKIKCKLKESFNLWKQQRTQDRATLTYAN